MCLLLQEIPASPFRVKVDPSHDASKVKAEGPGLSKTGKTVVGQAVLISLQPVALAGFCLDLEGLISSGRL